MKNKLTRYRRVAGICLCILTIVCRVNRRWDPLFMRPSVRPSVQQQHIPGGSLDEDGLLTLLSPLESYRSLSLSLSLSFYLSLSPRSYIPLLFLAPFYPSHFNSMLQQLFLSFSGQSLSPSFVAWGLNEDVSSRPALVHDRTFVLSSSSFHTNPLPFLQANSNFTFSPIGERHFFFPQKKKKRWDIIFPFQYQCIVYFIYTFFSLFSLTILKIINCSNNRKN